MEPETPPGLRIAAASTAFAGLDDVARQMAGRLQAVDPTFRLSGLPSMLGPYQKPEFLAKIAEGLRRAGLPE